MKNKVFMVLIFLLGIIFIPVVNAEEIPREGVTYFLQYPNGTEDVEENYDKAIAASNEEKLILTTTTDSNGQIVLADWQNEGTIRVAEVVPEGYSTNAREFELDLAKTKEVNFTNHNGLLNPKTGQTVLILLLVLGGTIALTVILKKKKKAVVLVIPALLLVGLAKVNAANDNIVINVKDTFGNGQAGVTVNIYAKPKIDAAPAIKIDANGGNFFDGTTLMYVRIPYNGCNGEEWWDYLEEINQYDYVDDNAWDYAYREGYYLDYWDGNFNSMNNGNIIRIIWEEDPAAQLITIHGNGGILDFYGKKLETVTRYLPVFNLRGKADKVIEPLIPITTTQSNEYVMEEPILPNSTINTIIEIISSFTNGSLKQNGISFESSCSNKKYNIDEIVYLIYDRGYKNIYICWAEKTDGIYINDELFVAGNEEMCFNSFIDYYYDYGNNLCIEGSIISKVNNNNNKYLEFLNYTSNLLKIYYYEEISNNTYPSIEINKLEIYKNGQQILEINSNDLNRIVEDDDILYSVSNSSKNSTLKSYINSLDNNCAPHK